MTRRRERALRRLSKWQDVKVRVVSKRVAEAHGIVDALARRLADLQTCCADAEAGAFETAFSLGPQQALAAIRHSQSLRVQCDDLERKTESAREIVEQLQRLRVQEEALGKQAGHLADKRKGERQEAVGRRDASAIEDLILAGRTRGPK